MQTVRRPHTQMYSRIILYSSVAMTTMTKANVLTGGRGQFKWLRRLVGRRCKIMYFICVCHEHVSSFFKSVYQE